MRIGLHRRAARARRGWRRDDGQALVEMAIALPLLLILLVGIFEFARAYSIKQTVVNAAREGARAAVVQLTPNEAAVKATVQGYLQSNGISIPDDDIVISGFGGSTGAPVTVRVSADYNFILLGPVLSLISASFRDGVTLSSETTMRKE
ncbi:MAG: pilus assembly protein [Gemmatimonadota bacterium]|jgi:Flp pilus assembly protein TadG